MNWTKKDADKAALKANFELDVLKVVETYLKQLTMLEILSKMSNIIARLLEKQK